MKILFDQNISFRIVKLLQDIFPGCKHISNVGLTNADDFAIWKYARENGFSIITFDSDYYNLSTIYGHPPKIVWIRTGNMVTSNLEGVLRRFSDNIIGFITEPEMSTVSCLEIIDIQ